MSELNSEAKSISNASANTTVEKMIAEMDATEKRRHTCRMNLIRKARKHKNDIARCVETFGGRFSIWDDNGC